MESNKITVYHGCDYFKVAAIATKIRLFEQNDPSDFSAKSELRSFYTTKVEKFARGWARSRATAAGEVPAVIKFELNLGDLNVYDFGTETKGKRFEDWQEVRQRRICVLCWPNCSSSLFLTTTRKAPESSEIQRFRHPNGIHVQRERACMGRRS
jgi:hypothetical protein